MAEASSVVVTWLLAVQTSTLRQQMGIIYGSRNGFYLDWHQSSAVVAMMSNK